MIFTFLGGVIRLQGTPQILYDATHRDSAATLFASAHVLLLDATDRTAGESGVISKIRATVLPIYLPHRDMLSNLCPKRGTSSDQAETGMRFFSPRGPVGHSAPPLLAPSATAAFRMAVYISRHCLGGNRYELTHHGHLVKDGKLLNVRHLILSPLRGVI